jgi:hypothetical protein
MTPLYAGAAAGPHTASISQRSRSGGAEPT